MIILVIAATRMYRSLDNHGSPRNTPRATRRTVISDMRVRTVPFNQTDLSVPSTDYGQYPTTSQSDISADPHKAHEVSLNVDVESGPEK
jgi:hypothetical protein